MFVMSKENSKNCCKAPQFVVYTKLVDEKQTQEPRASLCVESNRICQGDGKRSRFEGYRGHDSTKYACRNYRGWRWWHLLLELKRIWELLFTLAGITALKTLSNSCMLYATSRKSVQVIRLFNFSISVSRAYLAKTKVLKIGFGRTSRHLFPTSSEITVIVMHDFVVTSE